MLKKNKKDPLRSKPVILTLVERKTRKSLYILVKNKTQKGVTAAIRHARKRVVPKRMDLNKLTREQLQRYEDWVNNYPRKIFGYKTSPLFKTGKNCWTIKLAIFKPRERFNIYIEMFR